MMKEKPCSFETRTTFKSIRVYIYIYTGLLDVCNETEGNQKGLVAFRGTSQSRNKYPTVQLAATVQALLAFDIYFGD